MIPMLVLKKMNRAGNGSTNSKFLAHCTFLLFSLQSLGIPKILKRSWVSFNYRLLRKDKTQHGFSDDLQLYLEKRVIALYGIIL